MDKCLKNDKAITLIALVITIIVLLILAGIAIGTLFGDNGIISNTFSAKDDSYRDQVSEDFKIKIFNILSIHDDINSLEALINYLKSDSENSYIFSLEPTSDIVDYDTDLSYIDKIYVVYNGYQFKIDSGFNVSYYADYVDGSIEQNDTGKILAYRIKDNNEPKNEYIKYNLNDLSGHGNNCVLYNISVNDDNDGIVFNGSSGYGELNLHQDLTFPLTVEMDIKTSVHSTNSLIYLDPTSRIALGIWSNYFILSAFTSTNTIPVPSDFFDGNLKHIVIEYSSLTDFELYINGQKLSKNSSYDRWSDGVGSVCYLGRRGQGNYFNGTLYNFRIYNRLLDNNELESTTNRSDLILEYDVSKDSSAVNYKSYKLNDLTGNGNDSQCTNVYYNAQGNGIIFNGTSSYVELGLKENLTFPLTIEMSISTFKPSTNSLIYLDPVSLTSFGIWDNYFILSAFTSTKTYPVPSDFFDGNLKHIVIKYSSLTDSELYINGQKLSKNSSYDGWTSGVGSVRYLGRRGQGNYFNGTLYEFNIYDELISEDKINVNYNKARSLYK